MAKKFDAAKGASCPPLSFPSRQHIVEAEGRRPGCRVRRHA
jgi:hypothetical protein